MRGRLGKKPRATSCYVAFWDGVRKTPVFNTTCYNWYDIANYKWKVAVSQMNARPKYKGIGIESGCRWLSRPFAFRPGCAFTELTLEPNKLTRKYSRPGPLHPAKSKVDTITAHLGQGSFSHCSWKRNYEKICQQLRQTCLYCRNWKFLVM